MRDHAESIAFFRGERREHQELLRRFGAVVRNTLETIGWSRNLRVFTHSYNYIESDERLLYEHLYSLGFTYVSISHRNTLQEFHDLLLTLHPNGRVELLRLRTDQREWLKAPALVPSWRKRLRWGRAA